jgi:carbon monoxide dehydrogenase subunit G
MIETDHTFVVEASIGDVWAYASDIGNWASSMPGYESFEAIDDQRSSWVLKVALGALVRRVELDVTITEMDEPDRISFELRGGRDPVAGRGTFVAAPEGPRQTSVVVSLAIWGSGPMAASMEAMSRPVVPRMTRVVGDSFKSAIEQTDTPASDVPRVRDTRWARWRAWLQLWTRRSPRDRT